MKLNIPQNIADIIPYPPGKPLEELEREYGITDSIKLASNENARGPFPKAVAEWTGAASEEITISTDQKNRRFVKALQDCLKEQGYV